MKKYVLSFSLIVAFAFYIAFNNRNALTAGSLPGAPAASNAGSPSTTGNGADANAAGSGTPAPAQTPTPTPAPTPAPAQAGAYKNGSYTGSVADAFYGNVQVQAVVANGKLANVNVLQYPNDRGTSRQINTAAMPQLVQEAIQVQNANVNIVSGATQSSQAFQQSLAAALSQAKA